MSARVSYFNRALTALFILDAIANHCLAESCVDSSEGSVRLADFNSELVGYVEICQNETWTRLLTEVDSWTHKNSIVVCQQLGYLGTLRLRDQSSKVHSVLDIIPGSLSAAIECTGTEQSLRSCIKNPLQDSPQGQLLQFNLVACREAPSEGNIRLVDVSSREGEGLVEMYYPRRAYRWSTVCTDGWDDMEAEVVCQQLGYRTGKSKFYSAQDLLDEDQLPRKRYDNFKCNGTEASLSQCPRNGPYPYKCYSASYAGVVCQNNDDPVKLHVPPTAAFLVLVTGVLLLVLVVVALAVKCAIKTFKKKVPPREGDLGESLPHAHRRRVNRIRLEPQGWSHTSGSGYSPMSNPAPPSYAETVRADQEQTQHFTLPQEDSSLSGNHQELSQTNGHNSTDSNTNCENSDTNTED